MTTLLHALLSLRDRPEQREARLARAVRLLRLRRPPTARRASAEACARRSRSARRDCGAAACAPSCSTAQSLNDWGDMDAQIVKTRGDRRRRHGRLDRRGRAGEAARPAARHHARRIRRDRHRRRRRIDHSDRAHLSRAARHRRARVHARDRSTLQARHLVRELGARSATATSTRSARSANRPGWPTSTISGCRRARRLGRRRLGDYCFEHQAAEASKFAHVRASAASTMPITSTPGLTPATCAASPSRDGVRRVEGKIAEVAPERRERLHRGAGARPAARRRRPVHRLHRLSRRC